MSCREVGAASHCFADLAGCLFGIVISCKRLNPTNPYVMAAVTETHVCSLDSPLGKMGPGTPPRASRYLCSVPLYLAAGSSGP